MFAILTLLFVFVSISFAQGIAIIKTLPGYASSIASAIDTMNMIELAGTIAGDDTIMMVPRDGAKKADILNQLAQVIPGIKN